jgi:hypothetical protein
MTMTAAATEVVAMLAMVVAAQVAVLVAVVFC